MSTNADEGPMSADLETPTTTRTAGGRGSERMLPIPRATASDSENADGGRRPCEARTKRGEPCGRLVGTRDYGDGSRCPSHRPKLVGTPKRPKPPVAKLASL